MTALMTEAPHPEATHPEPATAVDPGHEWTLEDLTRLPDDGRRYEILDGSLLVSPAPASWHQFVCAWLLATLTKSAPTDHIVLPGANLLLPAPLTRLFIPDVLVVHTPPGFWDKDDHLTLPPDLVPLTAEVVSRSSVTMDRIMKPALYAEAGVGHFWRVENGPDGPTVHVFALGGGAYKRVHLVRPGERVEVDAPWPIHIAPPVRGGGGAPGQPAAPEDRLEGR
jgi:Uma2 family endonuclease